MKTSNPMGRPKKNVDELKDKKLSVYLSEVEYEKVKQKAKEEDISCSALIIKAIKQYIE